MPTVAAGLCAPPFRIAELRNQGYRWVVDADIDAFFDNMNRPEQYGGIATSTSQLAWCHGLATLESP